MRTRRSARRASAAAVAVALAVLPVPAQRAGAAPAPCGSVAADANDLAAVGPRRLAVLAFDTPTGDRATHEIAVALGARVSARLRDVRPLEVIARDDRGSAAASLNGRTGADARYLLAGTLDRRGHVYTLALRLLDGGSGRVLWRGSVTRARDALAEIEVTAATAAATHTLPRLTASERTRLTRLPTTNGDAYLHLLRGAFLLDQAGMTALEGAVRELDQAWRLDPKFADAWTQLAMAYGRWANRNAVAGHEADSTVLAGAMAATDRALALDPRSSEAWVARAVLLERRNPRATQAVREAYERALALDPADAEAHRRLGRLLTQLGERAIASAHLRTALLLEPESARTLTDLASLRLASGDTGQACTLLNAALESDPGALDAYALRVLARLPLREYREAWADAETATRLGSPVLGEAASVLVDVAAEDTAGAHARVRRLLARPALANGRPMNVREARMVALALMAVGDHEGALRVLERVRPRGVELWRVLQDAPFAPLRDDDRFRALLSSATPAEEGP